MSESPSSGLSRRELLKTDGARGRRHWAGRHDGAEGACRREQHDQVALVGCGGRGTGAAVNALSTKSGPTKLVAMADVFPNKLDGSYEALKEQFAESPDKVDVPDDRKFVGFDGYKQAMDCLQPGRRGDLGHAARLPLGPFHLCDRQGPERLHGEADHGRRPHARARCSSWPTNRWPRI